MQGGVLEGEEVVGGAERGGERGGAPDSDAHKVKVISEVKS